MNECLFSKSQIREFEEYLFEHEIISSDKLKEKAAKSCEKFILKYFSSKKNVIIFVGKGINGEDGVLLSRLLLNSQNNYKITLFFIDKSSEKSYKNNHADLEVFDTCGQLDLSVFDLIIDCIFGIGLNRCIDKKLTELIIQINQSSLPIISIDMPSGLNADNGCVMGSAVKATHTLTFLGLKFGQFTFQGLEFSGKVSLFDFGLGHLLHKFCKSPSARLLLPKIINELIPYRQQHMYKNMNGHTLVIGGDTGMFGALILAARSALMIGSGLVTVLTRKKHASLVSLHQPELISYTFTKKRFSLLEQQIDTIVIGPGLGRNSWGTSVWNEVKKSKIKKVIDADALYFLSKENMTKEDCILTPHLMEASRLLNIPKIDIQHSPIESLKKLTKKYNAKVVLKGAGSLLADSKENIYCTGLSEPAMASAGFGDVLSGITGGLISQGMDADDALKLAVYLHVFISKKIVKESNKRVLLASDLLVELQRNIF